MNRSLIKIVFLLWLGCYLSGPLAETFDSWDSPREELHDVQRNAGGTVTLVLAVFCLAALLFRRWQERVFFASGTPNGQAASCSYAAWMPSLSIAPASSHSPPLPLRI